MKVLISIPDRALKPIDAYCESERYTRSQLMIIGTLEFIKNNPSSDILFNKPIVDLEQDILPKKAEVTAPLSKVEKLEPKRLKIKKRGFACPHGRMWGLCENGCK